MKTLKDEKIEDLKIIKQLDKSIDKYKEELKSMKVAMKSELQSYSLVLQKSCVVALEPLKIAAPVVKTVI